MAKVKVMKGLEDISEKMGMKEIIDVTGKKAQTEIINHDGDKLDRNAVKDIVEISGNKAKQKEPELVGNNGRPLVKVSDMEMRINAIIQELTNLIVDECDFPMKWIIPIENGIYGFIVKGENDIIIIGKPMQPEGEFGLLNLSMSDLASIFDFGSPVTAKEIAELLEYNEEVKKEYEEMKRQAGE